MIYPTAIIRPKRKRIIRMPVVSIPVLVSPHFYQAVTPFPSVSIPPIDAFCQSCGGIHIRWYGRAREFVRWSQHRRCCCGESSEPCVECGDCSGGSAVGCPDGSCKTPNQVRVTITNDTACTCNSTEPGNYDIANCLSAGAGATGNSGGTLNLAGAYILDQSAINACAYQILGVGSWSQSRHNTSTSGELCGSWRCDLDGFYNIYFRWFGLGGPHVEVEAEVTVSDCSSIIVGDTSSTNYTNDLSGYSFCDDGGGGTTTRAFPGCGALGIPCEYTASVEPCP